MITPRNTHDLGRFFVYTLPTRMRFPLAVDHAWEVEPPYRISKVTLIIRLWPFRRALGFGWWLDSAVRSLEDEAAMELARETLEYEQYVAVNGEVDRDEWRTVKRDLKDLNLDPEDEMALMQARGLFGGAK